MTKITEQIIEDIKNAKTPIWKKFLLCFFCIFSLLGMLCFSLIFLKGKKQIKKEAQYILGNVNNKITQYDLEAKVKIAEAAGVEKRDIDQIKLISLLPTEKERAEKLAELAKEDY